MKSRPHGLQCMGIPSRRDLSTNSGGNKLKTRIVICCLLLSCAVLGVTTAASAQAKPTFASVLNSQLSGVEGEVVARPNLKGTNRYT